MAPDGCKVVLIIIIEQDNLVLGHSYRSLAVVRIRGMGDTAHVQPQLRPFALSANSVLVEISFYV